MRLLSVLGLVLLCAMARGQTAAPALNTLTPEEAAAGWLTLFDGDTSFGWQARGDAQWSVGGGMIQASSGGVGVLATTCAFANFELRLEVEATGDGAGGILLRGPVSGAITKDNTAKVSLSVGGKWPTGSVIGEVSVGRRPKTAPTWIPLGLRVEDDRIIVSIDGKPTCQARHRQARQGVVALQYSGIGRVRFRNIRLLPLGGVSLFNGKNLDGWRVVPGHPSVYSVTADGLMNVRGGNGDIQTTATFADFILQLGVRTHGDHLNSGIFFRAIPGEFWSGYETQIRNQWEGEDRTRPVDFGTGGLYNRVAARRVASSDREWFTVTTIAQGAHIATWVDGFPVVDYVDTRPSDESNARKGTRTTAGVITLQGHDPTTNIDFRSIRIIDMKPAAPAAGK